MKNKAYLLTAVGKPGRGKTTLMISTINLALADNKKVLFWGNNKADIEQAINDNISY